MRMINKQSEEDLEDIGLKSKKRLHLNRTSLASVESLTMPLVQEVVLLADFQCLMCQQRVADIITRINGVTESVEVSVLEKKVTLTFSNTQNPSPIHQVAVHPKRLNKVAFMRRLFRSFNN